VSRAASCACARSAAMVDDAVDGYDPDDDPAYHRYIAAAAKECNCCSVCCRVPCDGCLAGGMCDATCHCSEDDDEEEQ